MDITAVDLTKALAVARSGAEEACAIMMRLYRGRFGVYNKKGALSRAEAVVTEADILCDEALAEHFARAFPEHSVVSEESAEALARGWEENDWIWYIDPIDGSLSFAEGTDNFGVSVGLAFRGVPVLGVLRNPARGLEAWSVLGGGAWLNGKSATFDFQVHNPPRLLLSSNQSGRRSYRYAIELMRPGKTEGMESVVTKAIYLLRGDADFYFSLPQEIFGGPCPKFWDVAGAAAIVAEAGGVSSDFLGEPFTLTGNDLCWRKGHLFAHPEAASFARPHLDKLFSLRKNKRGIYQER